MGDPRIGGQNAVTLSQGGPGSVPGCRTEMPGLHERL